MRNLLLSSFVFFVGIGCNYGHYKRLKPLDSVPNEKPPVLNPVFKDSFNSFLFRTNIRLYTKDFSGLLITKQVEPGDYRVIFTTELGMKLFDFEFRDTSFTLHYCASQFNRPIILSTIKKDIEILLMNDIHGKTTKLLSDKKNMYTIYKIKSADNYNYFYSENTTKNLVRIEHSGKNRKKIIYSLDNYQGNFPNHILIKHSDIRLKIELNLLKR